MMNIWRACSSRAAWLWMLPSCRSVYWLLMLKREQRRGEQGILLLCCILMLKGDQKRAKYIAAYWCSKAKQSILLHIDAQKGAEHAQNLKQSRWMLLHGCKSTSSDGFSDLFKLWRIYLLDRWDNLSIMGAFKMQTFTQKRISCFILLSACSNGLVD